MKPHSVNYFVSIFSLSGLLLLSLIGINMVHEIEKVEQAFSQSHMILSKNELKRGINSVVSKANEISDKLAKWDETSQQLTNPTYYRFWQQRRVHAVNFIPDYVNAVELYGKDGKALLHSNEKILPGSVPNQTIFIVYENMRPWLCVFKPIMLHQNSEEIFGYVGLKMNFLIALLELNVFSHLDNSSITFNLPDSRHVLPKNILNFMHSEELHSKELDQLKNVIYETFVYIVALVLLILIVLYWLVLILFVRPLIKLNEHIESNRYIPGDTVPSTNTLSFSVSEFNNFSKSLRDYQCGLIQAQDNLQKLNTNLEQRVIDRTAELQTINNELEAFSYSVSHDLRSPLRSIDGFSQMLLEDYSEKLDEEGKHYLVRVRSNAQRMGSLIDELLSLARITRIEINTSVVSLSDIALSILKQLQEQHPQIAYEIVIANNLEVTGDEQLLQIMLNNLLGNAWKYSSKSPDPRIEFGSIDKDEETIFYVKDNGAGFDMKYIDKVFDVFERLHGNEYEGTGIGLATVRRIVNRHNGRIWADSSPGAGASFYFTLAAC